MPNVKAWPNSHISSNIMLSRFQKFSLEKYLYASILWEENYNSLPLSLSPSFSLSCDSKKFLRFFPIPFHSRLCIFTSFAESDCGKNRDHTHSSVYFVVRTKVIQSENVKSHQLIPVFNEDKVIKKKYYGETFVYVTEGGRMSRGRKYVMREEKCHAGWEMSLG